MERTIRIVLVKEYEVTLNDIEFENDNEMITAAEEEVRGGYGEIECVEERVDYSKSEIIS